MNKLVEYSDSEDESPSHSTTTITKKLKVDLTPSVETWDVAESSRQIISLDAKEMTTNVPLKDLDLPVQGPSNPFSVKREIAQRNTLNGFVESHHISDESFRTLQRTYVKYGYTVDPNASTSREFVGDIQSALTNNGALINDDVFSKKDKRKRKPKGDPADVDHFAGPWAGFEGEQITIPERTAEQDTWIPEPIPEHKSKGHNETTTFHGASLHDYQGRTYISVPRDVDVDLEGEPGNQPVYLPKKHIHTWTGHTKGVNTIKWFPKSAHLLLSCSMDSKVKLWDAYHDRRCLRTFSGHMKGVRDISFSNDGRHFLSASYDKFIKYWDTETGQCVSRFTPKRIPNCVTLHPDPEKQHVFLTGCQDKKIYQFDIRSGEITQEYDQHLGPVNSITFIDENRRFVTTSDDKSLRAWEWDIPVTIKNIAEPDMHSMPAVTPSPNKKWLACTSLDNTILIYSALEKVRPNHKKVFRGHLVAGYACKPGWSPDGKYVMSGDSEGKLWFWDWKSTRILKKMKVHDGVVMNAIWHPFETSKVATCSWDGTIKYWD